MVRRHDMRKLAGLTIGSFVALVGAGAIVGAPFDVGGGNGQLERAEIIIEKSVPDGSDDLPADWKFRVDSLSCGATIVPPGAPGVVAVDPGYLESLQVSIPGQGGSVAVQVVIAHLAPGVTGECTYRITELPADGWIAETPENGQAEVTLMPGDRETVPFRNVPPPEITTTTVADTTTTTVADTTTTTVETTTTAADTTTTVAATTTVPPTTAGTVAPELPATGSSNGLTALLAGLLVLGGLGTLLVSRRIG